MNAKEFVDSLFENYEKSAALADFKEELLANLNAKVDNLVKKGMNSDAAFAKASAELGDVSALADELSLKKRKEVFEEVYMDIRQYMPAKRVIGYVVFGAIALFGITAGLIVLFAVKTGGIDMPIDFISFFATMMLFLTAAITGFTFLGVTQETASMYPVSKKRGAWYAAAAGLIGFGLLTMPMVYFKSAQAFYGTSVDYFIGQIIRLIPVISLMIPFILPGIGILVFLVLTEKERLKPWAKSLQNNSIKKEMEMWSDPVIAGRFGMFSGAIWIFSAGLFILFGFLIGFKYSWLVFIFAIAFQLLIQGILYKPSKPAS
jgi:hypothetical protein